ncbi:hypothetical protein D3C74_326020 [compost metagenome]
MHRPCLGAVLAVRHDRPRALGRVEVDADRDDPVVDVLARGVPGLPEDREHLAVLRQHLGAEPPHPALPRRDREVLEQHRAQSAPLLGIGDVEGDLGLVRRHLVEARDADDVLARILSHALDRDQGHALVVVDDREAREVTVREPLDVREEAQVGRALGLPHVEALEGRGVGRADGAHVRRAAVAQHHVRLPLDRVLPLAGVVGPRVGLRRDVVSAHPP